MKCLSYEHLGACRKAFRKRFSAKSVLVVMFSELEVPSRHSLCINGVTILQGGGGSHAILFGNTRGWVLS